MTKNIHLLYRRCRNKLKFSFVVYLIIMYSFSTTAKSNKQIDTGDPVVLR